MKHILIIASLLFIVASCGTGKTAGTTTGSSAGTTVESDDQDQTDDENNNDEAALSQNGDVLVTLGVVRDKGSDGCGFIIQMMVDANTETTTYYEPLEMPKEYREDGTIVRIEYRMSRRPSKCTLAIPIIIDKFLTIE